MSKQEFRMTEDHLKLLSQANIGWEESECGAPGMDPKRPYGNSDVEHDIAEILGWKLLGEDGYGPCLSRQQCAVAAKLHSGLEVALQILCIHAREGVKPGLYRQEKEYDGQSWRRVGD